MWLTEATHKTYWQLVLMLAVILYAVTCGASLVMNSSTKHLLVTWLCASVWLYLEVIAVNGTLSALDNSESSYPLWATTVHVISAMGCLALGAMIIK